MKLQWIQNHWTPDESKQACNWIIDAVSDPSIWIDLDDILYGQMLQYRHTIQNASNSGQAQAMHRQPRNPAMVRLSASLVGGLDHLFSMGNDPLMSYKDATMHTEVLNTLQSKDSEANDDLDRQAVERELRRYEEDGLSDTSTSLVVFWEVGIFFINWRHFPLT